MTEHTQTELAADRQDLPNAGRRNLLKLTGASVAALGAGAFFNTSSAKAQTMSGEWDKLFPKSESVDHQKITFINRYGITLSGDLYLPANRGDARLPALAVGVEIDALNELRDKPAGTIRIVAADFAISSVLWPKVKAFLPKFPDIKVELLLDNGLSDIVTERYDAGVRMGDQLAKDMISARIGPDFRFAVVGAPSYFEGRTVPEIPQDLVRHACINYRFPSSGALWVWEFEDQEEHEIKVSVDGPLVFNNIFHVLDAAVAGHGLGYVPEEIALPYLESGKLRRVLQDWSPYWDGYHLYYPSRRQSSPAFAALVEALRHRE